MRQVETDPSFSLSLSLSRQCKGALMDPFDVF